MDDATEVAQGLDPNDPASVSLPGDINTDGQVDLADYLLLNQYLLGIKTPSAAEAAAGDLNGSGMLDTGDLVILSRMILNLAREGFLESLAGQALLALWAEVLPTAESAVPNGALYYIHTDHLGTPQALTNEAGSVVWRATYGPFGKASIDPSSTVDMNVRFPGQYYDQETGLHYNWHRYYNPSTGRYITSDPIGLDGGLNTYIYALSNPINRYDPDGLSTLIIPRPVPWVDPIIRPMPWDPVFPIPMPNEDGKPKPCKRIGIKTDKWPGVPKGFKQCIYACKTDSGQNIIPRFVPEDQDCPDEIDWVPGTPMACATN